MKRAGLSNGMPRIATGEHPPETDERAWRAIIAAIGALILAIAAAGVVAIFENERVKDTTERALRHDIEIEDEGDDLRVSVLNLRHYHRNILFGGPSDAAISDFDQAFANLLEEIGELERIGFADPTVLQPAQIRESAERYYADFRPAIALYETDPQAFRLANDEGLRRIEEMNRAAQDIDGLGERLAGTSLRRVDAATTAERLLLIGLVVGVVVVGIALAIAAARILARLRVSHAREQAAGKELERALRTKTDFIADASHELRTPLTVISGNAEIARTATNDQVRREAAAAITATVIRMGRLVDDLLFLARSDAGAPPLEREFVPARWLVPRIADPADVLAQQRGACLTVEAGGEGYLDVDPARVEQAVLVLVDNAAKYSPPETCVSLTSRVDHDDLAIEVADAGPGIPPEEVPLIFDRFYQVGARRVRRTGGTGLGLAIARTIVEAHGGRIEVDSRVNGGTRMTIRLPLCRTGAPVAEPKRPVVPA